MLKLTLKNLKVFDNINKETNNFIRTPEPSEVCELDSMYLLADWLVWAYQNNLINQERYTNLSTYLHTIPSVGEYLSFISHNLFAYETSRCYTPSGFYF